MAIGNNGICSNSLTSALLSSAKVYASSHSVFNPYMPVIGEKGDGHFISRFGMGVGKHNRCVGLDIALT